MTRIQTEAPEGMSNRGLGASQLGGDRRVTTTSWEAGNSLAVGTDGGHW